MKTKTVVTKIVGNSKMWGMDSEGFPDIDRWGEIRIRVPNEFEPGTDVIVKYQIYRRKEKKLD